MSLPDVGDLEGINPTMLSRVIGRLVEMRLIDRIPDPADLRSVSVVATTDGRRVDRQIKARRAAAVSSCLELLPADDVAALAAALPALENLAETMRQVSAPDRQRVRPG
jgi:DNA-binding MarR family transcriptional regulator